MDCNKEEAARAKKLAEEKMRAGDFVGAHKLVTKAQRLFPNLENIHQMIAICDVHSCANKKMDDNNWYGILEVEPFADVDTIKKQYRKLTLLLHPDKNKFAGAESAFKLVGEANRLLSDKKQRSLYNLTYRSQKSYTCDKKLGGWASSSTAVKKESQDQVPETGEAKKMCSFEDDIAERRSRAEERQKWFEEALSPWASSSTAVKKESHQDQEPGSHSPFASMHSNANSENVDTFWRCFLVPPRIISTAGKKESHQDQEPAKKRSFSEVDGFDVDTNEHRRRAEEMRKRVEEATNKLGFEAERQKKRMEEFDKKLGGWASSSSTAVKKESQDEEPENGGEAKKMSSFEVDIAERRRRAEEIQKWLEKEKEKKTKNVHVKPDHSDTKVRNLAILWKGKIRIETPRSSSSLEVLAFLHFIVAHRLHNSIINQQETAKLASSIAHHKEAPTLFQSLGLDNVIPEFVEELINTRQYVPAVRLICFFKLKGFSPLHLLKKEIESQLPQDKDGGKLRDILELLADYKLQIDIPAVLIFKLMGQRPDNQNQVQPSRVDRRVPKNGRSY